MTKNKKIQKVETSRGLSPKISRLGRLLAIPLIAISSLTGCETLSPQGTQLLQDFAVSAASSATSSYASQRAQNAAGGQQVTINGGYQGGQAQNTRVQNSHWNDDYMVLKKARTGDRVIYGSVVEYTGSTVRFFNGERIVDVPVGNVDKVCDINKKGIVAPDFIGFEPGQAIMGP